MTASATAAATATSRGRAPRERNLPWVVVRECGRLDAVTPGIAVRGLQRYAPPATLWACAYWAEMRPRAGEVLAAAVLPGRRLVRRPDVLRGESAARREREGFVEGELAVQAATVAASRALGLAAGLTGQGAVVLAVDPSGPAAGRLDEGDVVVAAGASPVRTGNDLAAALRGGAAELTVVPAVRGSGSGAPVLLAVRPGDRLGAQIATHRPVLTGTVDADLPLPGDGAGPSAGLVLALGLVDVLTPGSLTGGRHVAVTGAVDLGGRVREVGGVDLKARAAARAGMDLLLVPAGQEAEARGGARGLDVVGVASVAEAVAALIDRGGTPPVPVRAPGAPRVLDLTDPHDVPVRAPGAPQRRVTL